MPKQTKREVRTYPAAQPLTYRTLQDGSKQIGGYAIVFNSPSVDLGGFKEICSAKMLTRTLRESPDILGFRDHKQELLLSRTTAGTLDLKADSKGLAFTMNLPNTSIGNDTAENVRLRNLTGVSFGFIAVEDTWTVDADGNVTRTLLDVDLLEISVTSFAAYPATSVSTRSCPTALRSKLSSIDEFIQSVKDDSKDADGDDSDQEDEDRSCECRCDRCLDDDCENCEDSACDDEDCNGDEDCPMQLDSIRADKLRIRQHFVSRTKFPSLK
jgi:uncharacterized protein